MKKSMMMKIFGIMIVALILTFVSTSVLAAEDDFGDLLNGNGTSNNNTNTDDDEYEELNGTNTNTNTNTNPLTTNGLGTNNNTNNTNNSYDNSNLPATGIQDSIPTVLLIVVFGISAVYAYKKIKDYQQL